jgi:tRNA1(Val) A37 N6-methylase TrmN6
MTEYDENYLLNKKVVLYQPKGCYHASSDAVWLAASVVKVKPEDKILDVGSGTGAVALCLAERLKQTNVEICGIEAQEVLCTAANESAKANGFGFVHFVCSPIENCTLEPCSFAHVVTNPPYSEDDMPSPNQSKAKAHNLQALNLESWLGFCIKMIKPQGFLYVIHRAEALENIVAYLHGRMGKIEIIPLYSKLGQPAKRIIVRAQKNSKAPLVIQSGVVVHENDGKYSPKAEDVLRLGDVL